MKQKIVDQFNKKHEEEIQAIEKLMQKIKPQLDEIRGKYPNIGYILHIGIIDDERHLVSSAFDMNAKLAAQITLKMLEELALNSRSK